MAIDSSWHMINVLLSEWHKAESSQ